jgi:hypothetical protein
MLTLSDAKSLVLATPQIKASIAIQHARPFFEYVQPHETGWDFTVNARNACLRGPGTCSTLLGHFRVSRQGGEVTALDEGFDGKVASSPEVADLRRRLMKRCG